MDDIIKELEGIFGKPLGRKAKLRLVAFISTIEGEAYERGRYERTVYVLDEAVRPEVQ